MNLLNLRKKNNLSQEELAKMTQQSQRTISSYECGKTEPEIQTLIKLANIFHVSIDELVGRDYPNVIDKGLLTDTEIDIIEAIKQLNPRNQDRVLSYTMALVETQKDEEKIINRVKGK